MTIGSLVKNQYFFMIALSVVMLFFVKKMPNMGNYYFLIFFLNQTYQRNCSNKCNKEEKMNLFNNNLLLKNKAFKFKNVWKTLNFKIKKKSLKLS